MIYVVICQEDKMILNLGTSNNITSRYIIFKLLEFTNHNYIGDF